MSSLTRRRLVVAALGAMLFVFVFFLRFNTLGGALGGFDDDHFVPFAYAKQVEAGDQPLRDFTGLGLQGVWPSLTYELSAAAQSLLGDTLRSEAVLSVTGVALAMVLAFVAATRTAPVWVAWGAAALGGLLATRLYNYPKVLVLGAGVLLIAEYARRPGRNVSCALGALTAVAFLFRHDYAVYVGVGSLAVMIAAGSGIGRWRSIGRSIAWYGLTLVILLMPSLIFVERNGGIASYWRDSIVAVEEESRRTERRESSFAWVGEHGQALTAIDWLSEERNAVKWLYYAHWVLPLVGIAVASRPMRPPWPAARATMIAWGVMALVIAPLFLRGNTGARFGDMAPLTAALLAGVCGRVSQRHGDRRRWVIAAIATTVVLVTCVQSVWAIGGATRDLDVSGWSHSPLAVATVAARRWAELRTLPRAYWGGAPDSPSVAAVQYIHECTRTTDRVLVISYQPELLPLADRRFAAGRASVIPGLLTDDAHQTRMVERWDHESVPIVLVEPAEEHVYEIPILYRHLVERYIDSGPLPVNGNKVLHVYAERRRPRTGEFGSQALPCFR